jgi:multidrug resistance efflux pump
MDDEQEHREEAAGQEDGTGDETPVLPEEESVRLTARVAELEKTVAEKDAEISILRQNGLELEERYRALGESYGGAVAGFRTMVVRTNPEIPEEMVNGETIEEVNESLDKAKALVGRVRQELEASISRARVPAGAPERAAPDLSALSPGDKIRYALGGNE